MNLRHPIIRAGVCLFLAFGLFRYSYSAILKALHPNAWITLPDQLQPLVQLLWHGTPIRDSLHLLSDFLRYGPTFYLIAAPVIAVTRDMDVVHYTMLALAHVFFWAALYLMDRRLFRRYDWTVRLFMVAVALNFTPALESLFGATLDIWELLAVVAAFFLMTSRSHRGAAWAAVVISANVMAKLMPLLVLFFLFLRRWTTVLVSAVTALVIMIAGQLFFGWEMGFGFPQRALYAMFIFGADWAPIWWENDAPRGLVYKALTGFHLAPGELYLTIDRGLRRGVDVGMGLAGLALLLFAIVKLWRWKGTEREELRLLGGFATAVVLYHLISPYSTHQYLPSTLLAYAFVLVCALEGLLTRTQGVLAAISLVLIGNIAPKSIIVLLTGMRWLNARFHSAPHFADHQMFTFYGIPGLGVILLGIVVLRLQWKLVRSPAGS
jgi:hypothetical protein